AQVYSPVSPLLRKARGQVNVWVQLQDQSLAARHTDSKSAGLPLTADAQRAWLSQLNDKHNDLSRAATSLGGRELGRVSKAHNAVAVSIDASKLEALAAQANVMTVRPVIDYHLDLSKTVPYIAASAVTNLRLTGKIVSA